MFNGSITYTYLDILILLLTLLVHAFIFFNKSIVNFANNHSISFVISILCITMVLVFLVTQLLHGVSIITWSPFTAIWNSSITSSVGIWLVQIISPRYSYIYTTQFIITTMLLIIIISIYYTVAFDSRRLIIFILYSIFVFIGGLVLIIATRPLAIFLSYEMLLLPTAYIIDSCSKTARSRNAAKVMVAWTQAGAFLLFGAMGVLVGEPAHFLIGEHEHAGLTTTGVTLMVLAVTIGFGTKMPLYPFYWWLPEAHVEVSTNFSIVLSGVSIKYAFIGYMRFIHWLGYGDISWLIFITIAIGFVDALLRIDSECDIKKIVAYQTVIEMHVAAGFIILDSTIYTEAVLYMLNTHCWISALQFILVDFITKRYHTRNIEHLYGIFALSPNIIKILFIIIFVFGAIPGTAMFAVEFMMQIYITGHPFGFILFFGTTFTTVVWSRNIWWSLWGGDILRSSYQIPFNLTSNEYYFILILLIHMLPPFIFMDLFI